MAVSIPAMVTPSVLEWARMEAGLPPERAAKRVGVSPDRLLAWERGEAKPTLLVTCADLTELKLLLAVIKSSLTFFYIKEKYLASSYNEGTTFP